MNICNMYIIDNVHVYTRWKVVWESYCTIILDVIELKSTVNTDIREHFQR